MGAMPAKNTIKQFIPNAYYHIYNRGVEKRVIFLDEQDYVVFLSYLKSYLLPKNIDSLQSVLADPDANSRQKNEAIKYIRMNNFADTLELVSYCLMPNHFHLLLKQTEATTIDRFMQSICTRYSMYMNSRYKRVGTLFQGVYKAVIVETDNQLLYLSRYIHTNPRKILALKGLTFQSYPFSSYRDFLKLSNTDWVKTHHVLDHFHSKGLHSYENFIEENEDEISVQNLKDKTIDE